MKLIKLAVTAPFAAFAILTAAQAADNLKPAEL
jgi:hypothetical protein